MTALERHFSLSVPSSTTNLALIREFVHKIGELAGMVAIDIDQLELAVDEACANVIEHAYGYDATREVAIRAVFDAEILRIEVIDTGKGFDPSAIPQESLQDLTAAHRSGGLGLRLIRKLMDEVHYEIEPGVRNELRMVKHLRKTEDARP